MTNPEITRARFGARRILAGIVGAVLAVALLVWALQGVHLGEVARHIRNADPWPLVLGVVLASFTFIIRLIRWRLLLRDSSGRPFPLAPMWHATAIGFMANNILPFRAGELVRAIAATKLAGARFPAVVSSVALERVFDGVALIGLLGIGLVASGLPQSAVVGSVRLVHAAQVLGLITLAGLVGAGAMVAFPAVSERLVRMLLPPGKLSERIVDLIEGIRHGFASLRSPALVTGVVFWSLTHWLVNAAALWVSFAAFDIPVGFGGALVVQGVLGIGVTVQLTPGFLGQFEAALVAGLALYGIPNDVASSYAIAYHGATFIPITLAGAWSLFRTPVALSDLRTAPEP